MKKKLLALTTLSAVAVANAVEIENPVVKKLYEKGIITEQEAVKLDENLHKEKSKITGKFEKIKFGGLDYIGYTYKNAKGGTDEGNFEIRRGYFITKFYFNKKDYARFTFDVTTHNHKDKAKEGKEMNVKIKHLYLYKDISSIIPATGFEIGMVHTPWLDYEEHAGWWERSISKTFYESSDGAHLLPSADAGLEFKTKTEYLSAEYGIFNGEGYDHLGRNDKGNSGNKPSIEGRITWHILGGGTKHLHPEKDIYANLSLHAVNSFKHRGSNKNLRIYQIHAVYNQPLFLIAGQYIKSNWYSGAEEKGNGYSVNFEIRPILNHKISFFGRYDSWNSDDNTKDRKQYIYGVAWKMNKHIKWLINGIIADYKNNNKKDYTKYMITAEVSF
ncbi:hypothetical protein [Hydrogenivirga sp. 128-5-R1-1]|uniref:hypothetical protein n=1 Tax=Hydrogenivirga sp. 128-5-R1-1 TaxID=392423 RepID=UPI00015F1BF4|nr:hypothetical protein [Hydrogenivirga sp. 128-5-R1-1]EDP74409.1 hypothetical protein HG1285_17524 [Hydrogenivirga sp. 128-5-R1-1]